MKSGPCLFPAFGLEMMSIETGWVRQGLIMLSPLRRIGFVSYRAMATLSASDAPPFKPFRLALVQMGGVTSSKERNLAHAKELVARAASPGDGPKPGVIVLPVGSCLKF